MKNIIHFAAVMLAVLTLGWGLLALSEWFFPASAGEMAAEG